MATVQLKREFDSCDEAHHPVGNRRFSAKQREQLIEQDLEAGYTIPSILTGVTMFGFLSMILSVLLAI